MLCLTRKHGEDIIIGTGPDAVRVVVIEIDRGKVRLGIECPKDIAVDRGEVRIAKEREKGESRG